MTTAESNFRFRCYRTPDSGVRILAPEGIGSVQTGPDATSKRANLFGAIYSIAVSKSTLVYSVRLIGNPNN
jgi:hypothetical protein